MTVVVDQVDVGQVRQLRHDVLRGPRFAWSESVYAADDEPSTLHLAAREGDLVVGCATWFPEPLPPDVAATAVPGREPEAATTWRLRGMAVAPDARGRGVGGRLMAQAFALLSERGADLLWCNARLSALPFYRAHGFRPVGEVFPSVGGIPHTVALRRLHRHEPTPSGRTRS